MKVKNQFLTLFNSAISRDLRSKLSSSSTAPITQQHSSHTLISNVNVFGWIEFPVWATELPELKELIRSAYKQAKEHEWNDSVIRLDDIIENGRYSKLESAFQIHFVPFDCGGKDPVDGASWAGWWRPGHRYPMRYEISSAGEEFLALDDLRSLMENNYSDIELRKALRDLVAKHDHSPPTKLSELIVRQSFQGDQKSGIPSLLGCYPKFSAKILSLIGFGV